MLQEGRLAELRQKLEQEGLSGHPDVEDEFGRTPLFYAVNDAEILECLLRYGADPNFEDFEGRTPLNAAIDAGNGDAVWLLLEHGASPRRGQPMPVIQAINCRWGEAVRAMLRAMSYESDFQNVLKDIFAEIPATLREFFVSSAVREGLPVFVEADFSRQNRMKDAFSGYEMEPNL